MAFTVKIYNANINYGVQNTAYHFQFGNLNI
jgi:hypothetical protein